LRREVVARFAVNVPHWRLLRGSISIQGRLLLLLQLLLLSGWWARSDIAMRVLVLVLLSHHLLCWVWSRRDDALRLLMDWREGTVIGRNELGLLLKANGCPLCMPRRLSKLRLQDPGWTVATFARLRRELTHL
jgi:hypothetical protein